MDANVYIDGLNLYYCAAKHRSFNCAVKHTSFKWLNLLLMVNNLLPTKTVRTIKYFSARVKGFPHDPTAPTRQDTYWRALKTIPHLEIIRGIFAAWPKLLPQYPYAYINARNRPPQMVQVERAEEKGSDVNLAAHLIYDNFTKDADESIVISNDSDLVQAIELVTGKLHRRVIVVNPNRTYWTHKDPAHYGMQKELQRVATECVRSINEKILAASQFPPQMDDSIGTFRKPTSW